MWLFTKFGFYSVVQKRGESDLTVRSRVRKDLDRLRESYLPEMGATRDKAGTDYPYRANASHEAFSRALAKIALDIDYDNFKNEVARELGHPRSHAYHDVWHALYSLEKKERS